jgi:hypothetical protein
LFLLPSARSAPSFDPMALDQAKDGRLAPRRGVCRNLL